MRHTIEPIPATFRGKSAEYKPFDGFRNANGIGKAVYALGSIMTAGLLSVVVETGTYFSSRYTARKSLHYKHQLEKTVPNGEFPKKGLVPEYAGYAEEIATNALRAKTAAHQATYMNVASTSEMSPQQDGRFAQAARPRELAGSRTF